MIAFKVAGLSSDDINFWSNLAAGLFILPFFLFSASAGQWAEKNEKSGLIRTIKLLEVVIMGLAAVGFWLGSLPGSVHTVSDLELATRLSLFLFGSVHTVSDLELSTRLTL